MQKRLVWKGLSKEDAKKIMESDQRGGFQFRVRSLRISDGKEGEADARDQGYFLIPYWHRKAIRQGEKLAVWTTLGKERTAGLLKSKATKIEIRIPQVPKH